MGRHQPERIGDDWIWAEYWTRYFTDRQPQFCWVVQRHRCRAVVGYLTGTASAAGFEGYIPFLLPGMVWRVVRRRLLRRPTSRAAILGMLGSILRGELTLPAWVRQRFPATFHFNVLAEARGRGAGSQLFDAFVGCMRSLHVTGVHAQVLNVNPIVPSFLIRRGFRLAESCPLHAFLHTDREPIRLQTWTLRL